MTTLIIWLTYISNYKFNKDVVKTIKRIAIKIIIYAQCIKP